MDEEYQGTQTCRPYQNHLYKDNNTILMRKVMTIEEQGKGWDGRLAMSIGLEWQTLIGRLGVCC